MERNTLLNLYDNNYRLAELNLIKILLLDL
jgi:hypothetical protein